MYIIKTGEVKTNPFGKEISFILLDMSNEYYNSVLKNKELFNKYKIIRSTNQNMSVEKSMQLDNISINLIINDTEKVLDILDNLVITNKNIYIKL